MDGFFWFDGQALDSHCTEVWWVLSFEVIPEGISVYVEGCFVWHMSSMGHSFQFYCFVGTMGFSEDGPYISYGQDIT